jgi:hypothetical protein
MQKPTALAASIAVLFTGCQTKSPTWHKVMATPRATGDAENRDRAYAAELHQHLAGIPHKVVTFEYDYSSKYGGPPTTQRTAVVYFDPLNGKQPWWVMDSELDKPVWLPNEPLPRQVSFFARRPARIIEVHDFTISRDKAVKVMERDTRPTATTTLQRVEHEEGAGAVAPARRATPSRPVETAPKHRGWKFWERPAPRGEAAVTTLQPVEGARASKRKSDAVGVRSDRQESVARIGARKKEAATVIETPSAGARMPATSRVSTSKEARKEDGTKREGAAKKEAAAKRDAEAKRDAAAKRAAKKEVAAKDEAKKEAKQQEPNEAPKAPSKNETARPEPAAKEEKKKGAIIGADVDNNAPTGPSKAEEKKPADAQPPNGNTKPEPAADPKKRRPLFNSEKIEPAPAKQDGAAADRPRRNLLQRIFTSLNPARWFHKTA